MSSPRLTITVPQPCHEDWEQMTPADRGRYCAVCAKVVVDFSQLTDAELLRWLSASPAATCGNFRPDQLDRNLRLPALPPPPSRPLPKPRWQAWLAAADADSTRYGQLIPPHLRPTQQ